MSEDLIALLLTVGFFVGMAVWVPLVECCERKLQTLIGRASLGTVDERVRAKDKAETRKGRGYEAAVLLTVVATLGSLALLN